MKPQVLSFYQQMEQISDKNYFLPLALKSQQIVRLSISFSKETKNIAEVLVG